MRKQGDLVLSASTLMTKGLKVRFLATALTAVKREKIAKNNKNSSKERLQLLLFKV